MTERIDNRNVQGFCFIFEEVINISASDNSDPVLLCRIISSNEPVDGLGEGDTTPDWTITEDLTLNLQAERSGRCSLIEYSAGNKDSHKSCSDRENKINNSPSGPSRYAIQNVSEKATIRYSANLSQYGMRKPFLNRRQSFQAEFQ